MQRLSVHATAILDRMEPNQAYEPFELRAIVPDLSMEALRQVMHELWVNRQVERFGYSGWRRDASASAHQSGRGSAHANAAPVKPEDLFDHDSFSGLFK